MGDDPNKSVFVFDTESMEARFLCWIKRAVSVIRGVAMCMEK